MAFDARSAARTGPFPLAPFARSGCLSAALALLGASAAPALAQPAPAAEVPRSYAIGAGSLDSVLGRFGRESGTMIAIDPTLTQGLASPGLQGSYAVHEALA
ncbi:STN domain-containing protein, partial [Variovorax sp.]